MAGSAELLQEYLVSVGYHVDAVSQKKLTDALSSTEKMILGVGTAVVATVIEVERAVTEFAYSMRKMYFDAQLAGTSAESLQKMAYAGKQVGINTESMARTMHDAGVNFRLPWMVNYASSLTHINETGKKTEEILTDLMNSDAIKKSPIWIGQQIMSNFGMDEDTFFLWRSHTDEMKRSVKELADVYKSVGLDPEKSKAATLQYTHDLDKLNASLDLLGKSFLVHFIGPLDSFTKLLQEAFDGVARGLNTDMSTIERLNYNLKSIGEFFGIKGGVSNKGKPDNNIIPYTAGAGVSAAELAQRKAFNDHMKSKTGGSRNERNNNPGNIKYGDFAKSHGATGSDGTFAIFPSMAVGTKAMQELLQHSKYYGGGGNDTIAGIISKWAPQSDKNDTASYIADVSKRMGMGANTHLNLNDPTVLSSLSRSIAGHEGMGSGTKINQTNTTTINVMGSGDPKATANAVAAAQTRVYGDNTRNMKGAFAT